MEITKPAQPEPPANLLVRGGAPPAPTCPLCGRPGVKVLYMGLPMKLCPADVACGALWGFWSWLLLIVPFNGWFVQYEGSYWRVLWWWLTGPRDDGGCAP